MSINLKLKTIFTTLASLVILYNFYVANNLKYEFSGDAADYVSLGLSLAKVQKYGHLTLENELADEFRKGDISQKEYVFNGHSTWRPPLWPFLIAGVFLLTGYNLTMLLIFKFLLHLLGTFIFYKILKFLKLRESFVILGSFLYAISPAWQLYSRVFLSEPLSLFFITLWLYFLIKNYRGRIGLGIQAFVAGILILSHPYYIFLPFSTWLILSFNDNLKIKYFFISSIICSLVISSWIIRNYIVLDTDQPILTTSSGAVMAKGWNSQVPELHTNTKGDLADENLVLSDQIMIKNKTEIEKMKVYKSASINFIKNHPGMIGPIIWKKLKSSFNPFPETPRPGALETGRVIYQILALLCLIYIMVYSRNYLYLSLAWGLIISTIAITIIAYSGFRFRMPQTAIEIMIVIVALNDLMKKIFFQRKKELDFP